MIDFSLAYALAVILFSAFLPGALFSLGMLRKTDFSCLEKVLAGFALGWIAQGFVPFIEYMALGIKFSPELALGNTVLLYVIAIAAFVLAKAYEDMKSNMESMAKSLSDFGALEKDVMAHPAKYLVPAGVLLIFFLNFYVRIQTLSPVFQELDPYFYVYSAQQLVTLGYNPPNDHTAWYPLDVSNHMGVSQVVYPEATWYSLYANNKPYDNNVLDLVANIYPPFAAAFAAFFLYLGLRAWYREEYALIASAVASFVPIFIMKLTAGEAEIQPYAFFSLAVFIGFFLWAQKKQDLKLAALAGAGYFAVSMGSSSEVVAATVFLIFIPLQALTMFLMKKDLEQFLKVNAVFVIFPVLAAILKSAFVGYMVISYAVATAAIVAFAAALYLVQRQKLEPEIQLYGLGGLVLVGVLLIAFTPVGSIIKGVALTGLQIAEFNKPLDRTIAEQGTSGAVFEPSLGFMSKILDDGLYKAFASWIFIIPSFLANAAFSLFSALLNALLGVNLAYTDKENSFLMGLLFFAMLASAFGLYRAFFRKEDTPVWFFIALLFPIALIGLLKAKYVIYLGFMLAASIAFVFGELEMLAVQAFNLAGENKQYLFYVLLAIGLITATMQFMESGAPLMAKAGLATRFQDDPAALQAKFSDLCTQLKLKGIAESSIPNICAAGKDAVAYANQSLNTQYDYNLCVASLMSDPVTVYTTSSQSLTPSQRDELTGASYRCERVSDYWIESMEWIRHNTENDSRITSWWDYGHWENWFGQRDAVIRNEHSSSEMIGEIAHDYISGTPEELKADMIKFDSKYALFDSELLFSGNSFGGKYGALNYLACARNNETNVSMGPGSSMCEFEHLWSQVYVPAAPSAQDACQISYNQQGVTAYAVTPVQTGNGISYDLQPDYCAGQTTLANGQNTTALFDLANRSMEGSLSLHKAFLKQDYTSQDGRWNVFTLLYTKDPLWMVNGVPTSGWEDRTGKFYDSNLYNAFVLENLTGFDFAYATKGGEVKIFKMKQ